MLAKRLKEDHNKSWDEIENQIWEIQEYLGFCPPLTPHDGRAAIENSRSIAKPSNFAADGFKIFLYPGSDEKMPSVYRAVRDAIQSTPCVSTLSCYSNVST